MSLLHMRGLTISMVQSGMYVACAIRAIGQFIGELVRYRHMLSMTWKQRKCWGQSWKSFVLISTN